MPRRSEPDYLSQAASDFFRDTKLFSYLYDEPFDRGDVDIVARMVIREFRVDNTEWGTILSHIQQVPYVSFCATVWLLGGGAQERFLIQYDLELVVEGTSGGEIARYRTSGSGKDGVSMYEQPFGNYIWYNSVFQQKFFEAMEYFAAQLRADRSKLMQAAGK